MTLDQSLALSEPLFSHLYNQVIGLSVPSLLIPTSGHSPCSLGSSWAFSSHLAPVNPAQAQQAERLSQPHPGTPPGARLTLLM